MKCKFLLIFMVAIILLYFVYVFGIWFPRHKTNFWLTCGILTVFHWIFIMFIWSFCQTWITDPGQVPLHWNLRIGDQLQRKAKKHYCLMCNEYKPDRTHHCKRWNRWVLCMDHHWPWVNNCIGFMNKKYFMLLLAYFSTLIIYWLLTLSYDLWMNFYHIYHEVVHFSNTSIFKLMYYLLTIFVYALWVLIWIDTLMFYRLHRKFIKENKTTIEYKERKMEDYKSVYDVGSEKNISQVYGTQRWLDWIPILPSFSRSEDCKGTSFLNNSDFISSRSITESSESERRESEGSETFRESIFYAPRPENSSNFGQLIQK